MQTQIDRRRYDTKTLSILDTFGAYFIDRYYNHIYLQACDQVSEGRAKNITDAYRGNVINYMNGIAKKEYYVATVKHLHEFYQEKSGFGSIVLSEFENKVLCAFIPPEFYRSFNNDQKDKVLRDIIVKTTNELAVVVIGRAMLPRIIDDHRNHINVEQLQDITLDILLNQRETYFMQFAQQVSAGNTSDRVPRHIVDKLKQALMDEKQARISLETDRDRALAIANACAIKMKSMEQDLITLRRQHGEMAAALRQPSKQPIVQPDRSRREYERSYSERGEQRIQIPTTTTQTTRLTQQPIPRVEMSMGIPSGTSIDAPNGTPMDAVDSESDDSETTRSKQQEMIRNKFNVKLTPETYPTYPATPTDNADVAESEFDADAWL